MGKSSPAKGQVADAERNPITTPSLTVQTAKRVAGMPPSTGGLIWQTGVLLGVPRGGFCPPLFSFFYRLVRGGSSVAP